VVSTSIRLSRVGFAYSGEWQTARNGLSQIQSLLPQIEKMDPQFSARIAGQISQALQSASNTSNPQVVLQNLIQSGTPDDIAKAADSIPSSMRDQYYQQAAWKAINQGDIDKATQIATQKLTNQMSRQQILDQIEQRSVWQSMNDGKIDEARILISKLRPREQRCQAFLNLANHVLANGDKKKAADLLEDARASLPDSPESYYHVSLLLNIAGTYSQIDPARGIQIMNVISGLLNKLIPAAETLQGFDVQTTFKDGEILMATSSQLSGTMMQFAEQLGTLATADYAGAVAAADTAGRPELRIMSGLSIASKLLNQVADEGQNGPVAGREHNGLIHFVGRGYNGFVQLQRRY